MFWNGPNPVNRPKRYKTEIFNHSTNESHKPGTSTQNFPTAVPKNPLNLKKPRLHWSFIILATQFTIYDPPTICYQTFETNCKVLSSVVWQQQMETTYIEHYIKKQLIIKTPIHHKTVNQIISKPFRPLPRMTYYEPKFID